MYKVLSAENCSGGDAQPVATSVAANQKTPSKKPHVLLQQVFYIQW
jgi:hypothetical protein